MAGFLTAWSAAGIVGPMLISKLRVTQIARHVPLHTVYYTTMWSLALLLCPGLICNALVPNPGAKQILAGSEEPGRPYRKISPAAATASSSVSNVTPSGITVHPDAANGGALAAAWLFVGFPLAWGVYQTALKSLALFR